MLSFFIDFQELNTRQITLAFDRLVLSIAYHDIYSETGRTAIREVLEAYRCRGHR